MAESILDSFNNLLSGGKKEYIGVSITAHSGVEMIRLDFEKKIVQQYSSKIFDYDLRQRQVTDYELLQNNIRTLKNELGVKDNAGVCLSIQNVFFGFEDLAPEPVATDADRIGQLESYASDHYPFTQEGLEATIAHCPTGYPSYENPELQNYAYSAIQREQLEKIKTIFKDCKLNLVSIETSYASLLKGLVYTGAVQDAIETGATWDVLLVNSNNYAIFRMEGNKIYSFSETPLAIKSYSMEEALQVVVSNVSKSILDNPSEKLVIISQSDEVSAELLKKNLRFNGEVEVFEFNRYNNTSVIPISSNVTKESGKNISLPILGACAYPFKLLPLKLDFLQGVNDEVEALPILIGEKAYTFPIAHVRYALVSISLLLLGISFAVTLCLNTFSKNWDGTSEQNEQEKTRLATEMKKYSTDDSTVNIDELSTAIVASNKDMMNYYSSVVQDMPQSVWLTYYQGSAAPDADSNSGLVIEGMSTSIKDIYTYYKNLKTTTPKSTVKLTELKIITDTIGINFDPSAKDETRVYFFEISNTQNKKKAPAAVASSNPDGDMAVTPDATAQRSAFDFSGSGEKPPSVDNIELEPIKGK
ncbi:hypothetical protein IJC60_02175 [bacterium]|nr:hypothetical protein [bacterium]